MKKDGACAQSLKPADAQIAELEANKAREYKVRVASMDALAAEVEVLRSKCAAMEGAAGSRAASPSIFEAGPEAARAAPGSSRLEEELREAKCRVKEMEDEAVQVMVVAGRAGQDLGRCWRARLASALALNGRMRARVIGRPRSVRSLRSFAATLNLSLTGAANLGCEALRGRQMSRPCRSARRCKRACEPRGRSLRGARTCLPREMPSWLACRNRLRRWRARCSCNLMARLRRWRGWRRLLASSRASSASLRQASTAHVLTVCLWLCSSFVFGGLRRIMICILPQ